MIFLWSAVVIVTQPWHRSLALRWREEVWKPSINSKGIHTSPVKQSGKKEEIPRIRKACGRIPKDIIEITQVPRRKINSCPNLLRMPTRSRRRILLQTCTTDEFVMLCVLLLSAVWRGRPPEGWMNFNAASGGLNMLPMLPMLPWMFFLQAYCGRDVEMTLGQEPVEQDLSWKPHDYRWPAGQHQVGESRGARVGDSNHLQEGLDKSTTPAVKKSSTVCYAQFFTIKTLGIDLFGRRWRMTTTVTWLKHVPFPTGLFEVRF